MLLRYYNQITDGKIIYSIDNIRLSLRGDEIEVSDFLKFVSEFEMQFEPGDYKYFSSYKMFTYRHLFSMSMGDSSISLGIDFIDSKKHDSILGFLDFNPNKVSHDDRFNKFMHRLMDKFKEIKVTRWDLAIDLPVPREYLRLEPDMRNYETHKSHTGYTEYLGVRNSMGRVKLYDKTKESNLDYSLTRLEITLNGDTAYSDIPMPKVLGVVDQMDIKANMDLNSTDLVLYRLLLGCDNMVSEFKCLGRDKQKKLKPYLFREDKTLSINHDVYIELLQQLNNYEKALYNK